MRIENKMDRLIGTVARRALSRVRADPLIERGLALQGTIAAAQQKSREQIDSLADIEFSVFSQWGEDGIIEWLVHCNGPMPETFVEFGVENYRESNTRFLLMNRNWRGLVIDGSSEHIDTVRNDHIAWRHDLSSSAAFITADNINQLISGVGFSGETGLLSVDIDGNDYWVWKAIDCISPHIVIVEYNTVFGDIHPLSVPYKPDFSRNQAHFSNLYWGASIAAFEHLAKARGYTLLGSNRAGSNAFFIRNDRLSRFASRVQSKSARPSRFRESLDAQGRLSFIGGEKRAKVIGDERVANVESGDVFSLRSLSSLYSASWSSAMTGQAGT